MPFDGIPAEWSIPITIYPIDRVARSLVYSRALIAKDWSQNPRVGHCALQALRDATRYPFFHSMRNSVTIYRWNDASHRTQAQVLAAFDRAISAHVKCHFAWLWSRRKLFDRCLNELVLTI